MNVYMSQIKQIFATNNTISYCFNMIILNLDFIFGLLLTKTPGLPSASPVFLFSRPQPSKLASGLVLWRGVHTAAGRVHRPVMGSPSTKTPGLPSASPVFLF